MKRFTAAAVLVLLLLSMAGCSLFSGKAGSPVLFYYQRSEYQYGQPDGVICPEERDGTGHITDMKYLLSLYLAGPLSEELSSPFPAGLRVIDVKRQTRLNLVRVTLSGELDTLSESQRTLALACLTLTCLEMSGEESVVIAWDDELVTMDRSCLTLFDNSAETVN